MGAFFTYLIQSTAILSLFWLLFFLFMRNDSRFGLQRLYLLSGLLLSALLPLFDFPVKVPSGDAAGLAYILETITVTSAGVNESLGSGLAPSGWLKTTYFAVSVVLATLFLSRVAKILSIILKYRTPGENTVNIPGDWSPFSFFGYIFINEKKYQPDDLERIRVHEQVHAAHWHSIDTVMLELMFTFHWINPLFWLYRKNLKEIHEFIADSKTVGHGIDAGEYQQLIFAESTGIRVSPMTNNFSKSLIKRRIIMLKNKRPRKGGLLKYLFLGPLSVLIAVTLSLSPSIELFGQGDAEIPPPPPKATDAPAIEQPDAPAAPQKEEVVYKVAYKNPEFKGGQEGLVNYISENLKYPENAKKNKTTGKVYITFVVKKSGAVSGAKVIRSVSEELDAEALRVVREMPDWIPGENEKREPVNVQMTLPLAFMLDEKKKE